jgi:hypothetical protein
MLARLRVAQFRDALSQLVLLLPAQARHALTMAQLVIGDEAELLGLMRSGIDGAMMQKIELFGVELISPAEIRAWFAGLSEADYIRVCVLLRKIYRISQS